MEDVLDRLFDASTDLCAALDPVDLDRPSRLPGWSCMTIACHLRYGAEALRTMTEDALAGRPTSYYPEGRTTQRPLTLSPRPGESRLDVVASLRRECDTLHRVWRSVKRWSVEVVEPSDNVDLGPVELSRLALARLTEIEVHGTDLDLGLGPWSDVFVRHVLPMRLEWLNTRRANHRAFDTSVQTSWLLVATDLNVNQVVTVDGRTVTSLPGTEAETTITGTGAELLALLLGRAPDGFAPEEFGRAIPGP